jgi:hypothetical protein
MHTNSVTVRRLSLQILRGLHFLGLAIFFGVIVANIAIDRSPTTLHALPCDLFLGES